MFLRSGNKDVSQDTGPETSNIYQALSLFTVFSIAHKTSPHMLYSGDRLALSTCTGAPVNTCCTSLAKNAAQVKSYVCHTHYNIKLKYHNTITQKANTMQYMSFGFIY